MDINSIAYYLLAAMCLVPLVLGILLGMFLQRRVNTLGKPWGLLPMGGTLKRFWEDYSK